MSKKLRINSCRGCPLKQWVGGLVWECRTAQKIYRITEKEIDTIPAWCPLDKWIEKEVEK